MKPRSLIPIAAIIAVELVIAAVVLATGFVAVSDDDFSRVVIAERFAVAPSLDPSGTSWLPLPFIILGTKMLFLGRSLGVARLVAIGESAFALLLLYRGARNLSLGPKAAFAGVVLAAAIPTAARLGVSFQPEALTAGLLLYAASTLSKRGRERLFGGLALGAATLCRYEPWPAALVFAAYCALDARSAAKEPEATDPKLFVVGAVAALMPGALWMLHGVSAHGSALFFLKRVSAYRQALGGSESTLASLAAYPVALVRSEPGLVIAAVLVLAVAARRARTTLSQLSRPLAMLASLFLFLVAGRLLGGAPTHHDERPLLSILWGLAIVIPGVLFERSVTSGESAVTGDATPVAKRTEVALFLAILLVGSVARLAAPSEPYAARNAEIAIGDEAKRRVDSDARLLVDTGDYGYFAAIAAFGAPERAEPFDRRDPREDSRPDAFSSSTALATRLAADGASWFVARRENLRIASELATAEARNERFVLFRVNAARSRRTGNDGRVR
jgi:hypothetical protein